ncbi:cell division cycle protein 23-like [Tropilaelaps mercedesae]|uniref:Cell division cycle protein 23-like n=1 Tax=Tropilaelaps mercedesae TaxID=418985 RepID=A0A1V9XZN2_9ACAR|nr:cell division cycle protein 23-like [Tropilaelaps mercedesae]
MEADLNKLLATNFSPAQLRASLVASLRKSEPRCLKRSSATLAELLAALGDDGGHLASDEYFVSDDVDPVYLRCVSYFNKREYDRAAHFAKGSSQPRTKFIYFYARYQAAETKRVDGLAEAVSNLSEQRAKDPRLKALYWDLKREHETLDGYCLYLYGVVQRLLGLESGAIAALEAALKLEPGLWAAWAELSLLVTSREQLFSLHVPFHWLLLLFAGLALTKVDLSEPQVLKVYKKLDSMFPNCPYILTRVAYVHTTQSPGSPDKGKKCYERVRALDPCRLEGMDAYSELLYIESKRQELTDLAQEMHAVDPQRAETCAVIGNIYSLREEHAPALLYFKKAMKVSINYGAAWTLMGHEYSLIKNINAAIQCYHQAVEIDKCDHRAWCSLSLMYDQLKMYHYAVYYQQRALKLQPRCPKMLVAMGERLEKLQRLDESKSLYWKAHLLAMEKQTAHDSLALFKLGKLFQSTGETVKARAALEDFIKLNLNVNEIPDFRKNDRELATATLYLFGYYVNRDPVEAARLLNLAKDFRSVRDEDLQPLREKLQPLAGSTESSAVPLNPSVVLVDMTDDSDIVVDTSIG